MSTSCGASPSSLVRRTASALNRSQCPCIPASRASIDVHEDVRSIVRHHHERWDGAGYPDRIAGDRIPLAARIVAVADSVEAMSGWRGYRRNLSREEIVRELEDGRGAQWDPQLVDLTLRLIADGEAEFGPDGLRVRPTAPRAERHGGRAVLLVEGNPVDAARATDALERTIGPVKITLARDAQTAAELAKSSVWSIAVVDTELPDAAGLALMDVLRSTRPDLPVIGVTAEGSEAIAVEAFHRGAVELVVKGGGYIEDLTGRVCTLLEAA